MEKIIRNVWHRRIGEPFAIAGILNSQTHPEGLDVDRIRFLESGTIAPDPNVGHIISVLKGNGRLYTADNGKESLRIEVGVHLYLPPGLEFIIDADTGTDLLRVSSASADQARGKRLLLRDETFLVACASCSQSLRWILTPQYLSRRIFLHHDDVLLSKSGNPISWFRTTMFDVAGLPENEDGEPVFKMSYNSRTEFNVCYDVQGIARVRMARHPYSKVKQLWGPWLPIDSESTYHLNEAAGSPEEECHVVDENATWSYLRNKHEVHIMNGYVTLFCLFDPAPTGVECHHPGEYSDYEPLSKILGTESYETHRREIAKYDEMVDLLSLAKARGDLKSLYETPVWELYERGRETQESIESKLAKSLSDGSNGRARVLAPWMQTVLIS